MRPPGEATLSRAISKGLLALVAFAVSFGTAEALLRWTPLGDRYGWSRVPTIPERISALEDKAPGEWRILGLGDSFAVFREEDGGNFLRVAEREAIRQGFPVRLVNLGQSASGLREYTRNLERFSRVVRPDAVVVALYLGNDVFAYRLEALERAAPSAPAVVRRPPSHRQTLERALGKRSVFMSLALRVAAGWVPALRSGTLEASLEYLARLYGLETDEVGRRLAKIEPRLVERARADQVNPWDVAVAVVEPHLYLDLAALDEASGHAAATRDFLHGLDRIAGIARRSHTAIAFVLIPPSPFVGIRYHGDFAAMGYAMSPSLVEESALVRAISEHLAALGLPHLDLTPALRASKEAVSLPEDIHFDSHGQRVAGLALAEFLEGQGLLGPGPRGAGQRVARGARVK